MRWVIAGGGTGGHLFPGIAIAEAFIDREKENRVLFIGTQKGIEARVIPMKKFALRTIGVKPIQGRSFREKAESILSLPKAVYEAGLVLKEFRPQLVLGVGGYASGPTLIAAFLLRVRRAIQEQNMIPGMTNRILKWFSQRIFISFDEAKKYFPYWKTFVTGNPIRKEFLTDFCQARGRRTKEGPFTIFIFGGSAGAHRINQAMMEALDHLQGIRTSLRIIHQTGIEDLDFVMRSYQDKGFNATVRPFFENMVDPYLASDLVICRSGASTVAELAVCGKAALLIPYPYAAHQHQFINAQKLVDRGAARMILDQELNGKVLAQQILYFYHHPEERNRLEQAILKVAKPRAAEEIVDHCYALCRK